MASNPDHMDATPNADAASSLHCAVDIGPTAASSNSDGFRFVIQLHGVQFLQVDGHTIFRAAHCTWVVATTPYREIELRSVDIILLDCT